jgi:branched-chain amino acid transport system ATP-binding protein
MPDLELVNISLRFGGLEVLRDVSLTAGSGELLALIGPNGAGKTSVLNCISGIYRPQGIIRFRGREITGLPPHAVARLGVARTFQHGELFSEMTVLENLLVGRHTRIHPHWLGAPFFSRSVRNEEVIQREAVEKILSFVGLSQYRHMVAGSLPFGIQKIASVARALALEPQILLLDEPSAGLNREEREDLARFILRVKHELGVAMVWIEHDMQMVADLADRLHVLDYGRTIAVGTPAEVLSDARVIEAYLGRAGAAQTH